MTSTPTPEALTEARVWLVQPPDGSRDNSDTPRLAFLFDRFAAQCVRNYQRILFQEAGKPERFDGTEPINEFIARQRAKRERKE